MPPVCMYEHHCSRCYCEAIFVAGKFAMWKKNFLTLQSIGALFIVYFADLKYRFQSIRFRK